MREVRSRQLQIRRIRRIRRYVFLSLFLFLLCITGIIYSNLVAEATPKQESVPLYKYYTEIPVQRDDTLWGIAREHMGIGYDSLEDYMQEIRELNSISFNRIYYGQRIVIPYYSTELK